MGALAPFLDVVTVPLKLFDLLLQVGFKLFLLIDARVGVVNLRNAGKSRSPSELCSIRSHPGG